MHRSGSRRLGARSACPADLEEQPVWPGRRGIVTTEILTVDGRDLCRVHVRPSKFPVEATVTVVKNAQHEKKTQRFGRFANGAKAITDADEIEKYQLQIWGWRLRSSDLPVAIRQSAARGRPRSALHRWRPYEAASERLSVPQGTRSPSLCHPGKPRPDGTFGALATPRQHPCDSEGAAAP